MKLTCEKKELQRAATTVSHAISPKSVNPMFECAILTTTSNGTLEVMGSSGTLAIKTTIPANVTAHGEIAVNCRLFLEIINKYPDGEIEITTDDSTLRILCGKAKSTLRLIGGEFPPFPEISPVEPVYVQEGVIRKTINQVIFACGTFDDKPILTGVLFQLEGRVLNVVALDGYRMAMRTVNLDSSFEEDEVVIPSKSLKELIKILDDTDDMLEIYFNKNSVLFKTERGQLFTQLIEGSYVKYKSIIPVAATTKLILNAPAFKEAIERASVITKDETNNLIKFSAKDNVMAISSNSEVGNADEVLDIYMEGKEITIAFNAKYLLEVFKSIEEEEVTVELTTSVSPARIYREDNTYEYIVLPVQLRG